MYWIVFIHFGFYIFLDKWSDKQKKRLFFIISFVLVFALYGLRSELVGIDTSHYKTYFNLYKDYSLKELLYSPLWFKRLEPLFIIIFKTPTLFSDEYQFALIIVGLLYSIILLSLLNRIDSIKRYKFAFLFYGMYFMCSGLNIMRQAFALIFILHAYLSFKNAKKGQTIVLCLFGILCHAVAIVITIVMLLYLFFGRSENKAKLLKYGCILGTVAIIFLYRYIFNAIGMSDYLSSESADFSIYNLMLSALVIVYWNLRKHQNRELVAYSSVNAFIETTMLLAFTCCVLGGFAQGFIRITTSLLPFLSIAVVESDNKEVHSSSYLFLDLIVYLFVALYFWHNLAGNIGGVVPFEFYWSVG